MVEKTGTDYLFVDKCAISIEDLNGRIIYSHKITFILDINPNIGMIIGGIEDIPWLNIDIPSDIAIDFYNYTIGLHKNAQWFWIDIYT